jgi:hypothetical protein
LVKILLSLYVVTVFVSVNKHLLLEQTRVDKAASVVEWLACWPLVPKIAVSNPVTTIEFFGQKILSMPSFRGEVKLSVPCRSFVAG